MELRCSICGGYYQYTYKDVDYVDLDTFVIECPGCGMDYRLPLLEEDLSDEELDYILTNNNFYDEKEDGIPET